MGSLSFKAVAGLVTSNNAPFPGSVDGLMGLWYYPAGGDVPILNVLKNSTALASNIMSIWLEPSTSFTETSAGGEITFGGVDTNRFSGSVSYVNCVSDRPWTVSLLWIGSLNRRTFFL
jgi:hypothetical protein